MSEVQEAQEVADNDDTADDEAAMELEGVEQLIAKYFHPPDNNDSRNCKLCENIPSGQRRGTGSVVSFCYLIVFTWL